MATLASLCDDPFYTDRDFIGSEVKGSDVELWVQIIDPCQTQPYNWAVFLTQDAAEDAESIYIAANAPVKLYVGDKLEWPSGAVSIVRYSTTIDITETELPILPMVGSETAGQFTYTFAMLPVESLSEGAVPDRTAEFAGSRNKGESLYSVKSVISRGATMNLQGRFVKNDAGIWALEKASSSKDKVYFEVRYAPHLIFYDDEGNQLPVGEGTGSAKGTAIVTAFSMPSSGSDFQQQTCSLLVINMFSLPGILAQSSGFPIINYCQFDINNEDIDYIFTPAAVLSHCSFDINSAGFDYTFTPTVINYCQLDDSTLP